MHSFYQISEVAFKSNYKWTRSAHGNLETVVNGIRIAIANLTRDVGHRHWNLGVVHDNGTVEWVESGTTREEVEAWIPTIAEAEKDY